MPAVSWRGAQYFGQVHQHPGGRAPDVVVAPGEHVEGARSAGEDPAVALMVGGVDDEGERHLEDLGDLEGVGGEGVGRVDEGDHWRHLEAGAGDVEIELPDRLDPLARQPDL